MIITSAIASHGSEAQLPVLAIVGPTAAGKSDVAMRVARRGLSGDVAPKGSCEVEIVAADAFTVYRGMDIGTAKPSADERTEVEHHLIDVLDPWQDTNVAWFQDQARRVIAAIRGRGNVPLLVGGSGLYFRAIVDPLRFPPHDPDVRASIRGRYEHDPAAGHARLAEVDPDAAAKIEPENLRRTVRALEVIELTGESFSAFDDTWDDYESIYPDLRVRGLTRSRGELRDRIERRSERMVETGLLDEARRLRNLDRPLSKTARQGIGYREALAALDGELDRDDLVERIRARTWRYAKRQLSWFDKDPRVTWHDPDHIASEWT